MSFRIGALGGHQIDRRLDRLVALLRDAVESGASADLPSPLADADAVEYWLRVRAAVARGTRILLVDSEVRGAVQLGLATLPNARHRADLTKLFVRRDARGRGLGRALLEAAERAALAAGRKLIVLDPGRDGVDGGLYEHLGWVHGGTGYYRELS